MLATKNRYKYQVELKSETNDALTLDVTSHDDIFEKLDMIRGKLNISHNDEQAFLIGLKMAGEIILQHRDDPFFQSLKQPMKEIMTILKSNVKTQK